MTFQERAKAWGQAVWRFMCQAYEICRHALRLKWKEYRLLWELRHSEARKDKVWEKIHEVERRAKEGNINTEEYENEVIRHIFDVRLYEDDIYNIHSKILINKASRYMIPVPKLNTEEGGEWEEGEFEVAYRLKEKPRHELSEKVLAEERERLRGLQGKGSLLFGLIGMIIALVTVLAN